MKNNSELTILQKRIQKIINERDWDQFHNYKDLAISLSLETSEVLEHFQWKSTKEMEEHVRTKREDLSDELADVLIYLVELADKTKIDLIDAAHKKLDKNEIKYPVDKSKGKHTKYTEL